MKATQSLVDRLIGRLFTTTSVKHVSDTLEELSQDKRFKSHANAIVADPTLTDSQKLRQLSYLLKTIETPVLYEFLADEMANKNMWLFSTDRVDYFDNFTQQFQLATEELGVIYLTTAVKLLPSDLRDIAKDLSKAFGYKVIIKHELNPAIMGGAQVRVENLIFDYSIRNKFQQFERSWLSSLQYTEKVTGRNQPE